MRSDAFVLSEVDMKTHRGRFWTLVVVFLAALATAACGKAPRTNYYTVDFPPPSPARTAPAGSQVGVAKPSASHLLRQDRLVYFTNQNELNFYDYHRWAESPPALVQELLIRQLRGAHLFADVESYRAQTGLDYVLRGELLAMEEVDTGADVKARFALALELVRQEDARVVWAGRHACERPVAQKSVDAVVETLSGCIQETLGNLSDSLAGSLPEIQRAAEAQEKQ
jgi:ABC-type uncharacterized transport system auxiliary subunit